MDYTRTAATPAERTAEADKNDPFTYDYTSLKQSSTLPVRKVGKCRGGWTCENPDCTDLRGDPGNSTSFHFEKERNGSLKTVTCT